MMCESVRTRAAQSTYQSPDMSTKSIGGGDPGVPALPPCTSDPCDAMRCDAMRCDVCSVAIRMSRMRL
jgi:hypothetical protein